MASTHKLTDSFFQRLTTRAMARVAPLTALAVAGGWYAAGGERDGVANLVFLAFVAAIVPFSLWRGVSRQKRLYRTFCVEVLDDRIVRTQESLPRLEIAFSEITRLEEVPGQVLTVRTADAQRMIFLPATLERFEELKARLAAVRPIETKPRRSALPPLYAVAAVPLIGFVVVYRSNSPSLVLPAGAAVIGTLVCCSVMTVRSPHVDARIKKVAWLTALPMLSVAAKMWMVVGK